MRTLSLLLSLLVIASSGAQAQEPAATGDFQVDSDASWLRVLTYPDGPLRRFGHHHVVSHHGISGTVLVAPDPLDSRISLELSVAGLVVDDPELRGLEGEDFEREISQTDIDGTRANMLGAELLFVEQFPSIQIESTAIEGSLPDATIVASVSVKGLAQTVRFPASIELTEDAFVARGELEITHGELGLSPFTAAGGALSVRDLMIFKYEIAGSRVTAGD
jgi:polyisoprenoid-binding protein YceI